MRLFFFTRNYLIQKTAEATNIADAAAKSYDSKITKVTKTSPQNNSETNPNEYDKEIPNIQKKEIKLLII